MSFHRSLHKSYLKIIFLLKQFNFFIYNFLFYCCSISIHLIMPHIVLTPPLNFFYISTHSRFYVRFHLYNPFSFFFLLHHRFIFCHYIPIQFLVRRFINSVDYILSFQFAGAACVCDTSELQQIPARHVLAIPGATRQ